MNESEIRKIFLVIQNTYSNFYYDDTKVTLWMDYLRFTPFELAQRNVKRFAMDPANKFAPHPGVLAEKPVDRAEGRAIPGASETRLLLEEIEARSKIALPPIPDHVKQEVLKLAERNATAT